jgi:D-beta-D-heptose 7-phosphate kinase/D-beta-D-heptose 1-phosphate adenosyltransferase
MRLGFTNGVFDIFHSGHASYLKYCADNCDYLIVGLNSDNSVKRLGKGVNRPINSEEDRKMVLDAISYVSDVLIFDEDTPIRLIMEKKPAVLFKGGDYTPEKVVGYNEIKAWGGCVKIAPYIAGQSTTNIIEKIRSYD